MKNKLQESRDILWWLSLILGVIVALMLVADYVFPSLDVSRELLIAYGVVFPAYVVLKEVMRWTQCELKPKLGELFFAIWWSLFLMMGLVSFLLPIWVELPEGMFCVSSEMLGLCIEVLIVYVAGEISKKTSLKIQSKKGGC